MSNLRGGRINDIYDLYKYPNRDVDIRNPLIFETYLKVLENDDPEYCLSVHTAILAYLHEPVSFRDLYHRILKCSKGGTKYLYMGFFVGEKTLVTTPSGRNIYRPDNGHAMALLIDMDNRVFELFDPYGEHYDPNLYSWIKEFVDYINEFGYNFKYLDNTEYPIQIQIITDNDNFCVYWSLMYIELRMLNPQLNRQDIIKYLTSFSKPQLLDRIRRYANMVIDKSFQYNDQKGIDNSIFY